MSEQNFVPKANNNGQTLGTSARQWTAAYVSSVPDEDSAVVNKAYLDSSRASRAIFEIFPTFRKDDGPINGAYDCDGSEYSKSDFKGENNPYDMLVLGKAETCTYDEYNTQIANYGMCSKFALDTTNQKFKVPTVYGIITDAKGISSLAAPSTTSIQIPVVAGTNYPYTAPSNGWLVLKSTSISSDWSAVFLESVNGSYVVSRGPLNGAVGGIMPVCEGETVDLYAESGNAQAFFTYTIGAIEDLIETRYIKTRYLVQLATEGQEVSIQQYEDALYEYVQTLQQQLVYNRFVGEVFSSLVPINDNGVKLLDGSVLEVGGIYDEFINHIVGFKEGYPNLFCTEEEWNTSISTYGVCGKFVYVEGASLRLPKITGFIEGTLDATELGNLIEAGLPNLVGYSDTVGFSDTRFEPTGCFYPAEEWNTGTFNIVEKTGTAGANVVNFDASHGNPTYGKSDTVQPQAIRVYYYIVVANGIKQDVEIDLDNVLTEVNKRQRIMQKVKVTGTTPSIDVQSGKAYSCGTVSSLTINSLPGRDNFEESCILFTGTSSTSITVNSTDWSYVGDMSISSDGDYIISIMNNTLILNKVISGN